jgi:dolichyl-phosphate-mannose--protein O-mannosyl transferase
LVDTAGLSLLECNASVLLLQLTGEMYVLFYVAVCVVLYVWFSLAVLGMDW